MSSGAGPKAQRIHLNDTLRSVFLIVIIVIGKGRLTP